MPHTHDETIQLVEQITQELLDYIGQTSNRDNPVVRLQSPEQLQDIFGSIGPGFSLKPNQASHSSDELLSTVKAILEYSVNTCHPRFFNQNFAGADPLAVVGDWIGATLNTTNATYEAAPVFTLMEQALLQKLADVAGMPDAEGLFGSGGSLSNLFAMHLARHQMFPEANRDGLPAGTKLVAFTSEQAHYSLKKSAALLGMGYKQLRTISCDSHARMQPDALEAAILDAKQKGETPFFINVTAGTTVAAAFDPIEEIASIAKRHQVWMHVDGCYGASVLFSSTHRDYMKGVEQADSLAWNLHKMMGMTQQCSALLVKHPGLLQSCFATQAGYIFQPDKDHATFDSGDKHFQCARRVDVLKLWLAWKYRGDGAFAQRIDCAVQNAQTFASYLKEAEGRFAIVYPPSFTNVCFWWIPPSLRNKDPRQLNTEDYALLHRLAPFIKRRMQEEGTTMLGFQSVDDLPNFFRMLCINPVVQNADLRAVLDLIERYGMEAL